MDASGKVTRINWEPRTSEGLASVRAVRRDITDSLPDDPDVAGLPAKTCEIIYGGYRDSPNIWVDIDNAWKDLPSPWPRYNGIEVDSYCLWVFGAEGIACATHASILQCKNGALASPRWITYKTAWEDGFDVKGLSTCVDGTLAVSSDEPRQSGMVLWTGDYKVDLKQQRIFWNYQGTTRTESNVRPMQVKKMPIPCWPLFSHVLTDLEQQVGKSNHA